MSKVLIAFQADYADELDVYGWAVRDADYWEKLQANAVAWFANNPGKALEFWFGSNESIEFDTIEDFEAAYASKPITDNQAEVLAVVWDGVCTHPRVGITYGHFCEPPEFLS